jgi:hypothetical protein
MFDGTPSCEAFVVSDLRSDPASAAVSLDGKRKSHMRHEASRQRENGIIREAILLSQQGDMEAVHFLYARYAPEVFSCAREMVRDDRQAEEVMKGVFGDLVTQIAEYENGEEPFASWLLDVARTAARAHADPRAGGEPRRRSGYSAASNVCQAGSSGLS